MPNTWGRFYDWSITPEEKHFEYLCDKTPNPPATTYFLGMAVKAEAERLFPWMCQMRVAPYSYDWLDNFGRTSPCYLSEGLTELQLGQVFMTGFELVDFEHNRRVTIRSRDLPAWLFIFGDIAISYLIEHLPNNQCRLLVKLRMGYQGAGNGPVNADAAAAGGYCFYDAQTALHHCAFLLC